VLSGGVRPYKTAFCWRKSAISDSIGGILTVAQKKAPAMFADANLLTAVDGFTNY
jgi:hypothetical protein